MSFFRKVMGLEAVAKQTQPSSQKAADSGTMMLDRFLSLHPNRTDKRTQRQILEAYHSTPQLQMVLAPKGRAVASTEFYVERRGERVKNHPLYGILKRPNEQMTGYQFLKVISLYLDTVGECYLRFITTNFGLEVIPIGPHHVRYMGKNEYQVTWGASQTIVKAEDMAHFRDVSLLDPYFQSAGSSACLEDEIDIAEGAATHTASTIYNRGLPAALVGVEGASMEQAQKMQNDLRKGNQGPQNAGKFSVVGGRVSVQNLAHSLKDLDLTNLRRDNADTFRYVFGMPPEIIGKVENSNRATIDAADYLFRMNAVEPRVKELAQALTLYVLPRLPRYNREDEVVYESVVPDNTEFKASVMQGTPEAFTINEVRRLAGENAVEGGDAYLRDPAPSQEVPEEDTKAPKSNLRQVSPSDDTDYFLNFG